jgi:deoxyribonuclease-1
MLRWFSVTLLLAVVLSLCVGCRGKSRLPRDKRADPPAQPGDPDALSERGNQKVSTFRSAKKMIPKVFQGQEETFYCGCKYEGKRIKLETCGYKTRKSAKRAKRLEIEHVVPASAFGRALAPWAKGHPACVSSKGKPYKGRRCAEKQSRAFRYMEADLYNLQPAIGEVNGDRSDKEIESIKGEARSYGKCDVEIDKDGVEPRPAVRGDVARTYKYMDWAYPGLGIIHEGNRALIEAWDKADPVSDAERRRARRIAQLQGNQNPFIK